MLAAVLPSAASATVSATASVDVKDVYLTKQTETYTFTVNNTSSASETLASLKISRPTNAWTITNCTTGRTNWTGATATTDCTFNSTANPISAGGSETFTVTATTAAGNDASNVWDVDVKTTSPFGNPSVQGTASSAGALNANAWNFQIDDAVITTALAAPTIGSACPAPAKTAPTVSSRVVVVCGRQWGAGLGDTRTPSSGQSTLAGTMIGTAGTFASTSIAYGGSSVVLANYSASTMTSTAGTGKTVVVTIGSSANQKSPSTTLTDYEATLSPTTVTNVSGSGTYGGTATLTATLNSTSPASGVVSGKTIAFTLNGNPVGSDATDASGVASLSGVSLAGKDAGTETGVVEATFDATSDPTYSGSSNTGDLTVSQKPIDGSFTADDKTYDRTTTATFTRQVDATDIVGTDEVSLDPAQGTASFPDANVSRLPNGTVIDKTVTGSGFALTGADQANYSLVMDNDDLAKINPAPIDASFTTEDKVYDGTTDAAVLTRTLDTTDIVPGDEALVSLGSQGTADFATADVARDVGGNVIDQVVTASGFQLQGASADNYDLTVGTESAAISPKSLGGEFTAEDKTYDGSAAATILTSQLVTTDIVGTDDVVLDDSAASASFPSKAAGVGRTVTSAGFALTGAQAGNYALAVGTTTATINQRPTDGSFTAANKQYNGTAAATVTGVSFTDDVAGDALGLSGTTTFNSAAVGNGKPVTMASPALTGADAGNYVLGTVAGTTANITRRQVTGHFTAADKDYDGTTAATITGRSLSNAISGEDVALIGGTATFGNANPGEDKFVSGTGFSLSGANAGNYTLASVASTTATIRRQPAGNTPPPPAVEEAAEEALGGPVKELPFDLAGLGFAFAPENQTNTLKVGKKAIKLFAIGGCDAPCTVAAKKTLVLIGSADGASAAAKKRKIKLGTQNLSLAAGEFGVIKLKKLTKKQRKAIRKAQKSKLVVKTTLTSGGEQVVFKKKYRLKLKKG